MADAMPAVAAPVRLKRLLPLALGVALAPAWAQDPVLSSALDYSLNASRAHPITCKPGDLEPHRGRTLGDVFGEDWPLQPEPVAEGAHEPAEMTAPPRLGPDRMRGLPSQRGLVVAAVLVDASGKPARVETLCATTGGYDRFVQRVLKRAAYRPARINGEPITSVAIVVQRFSGGGS